MHKQYCNFERGSTPLSCIATEKLYIPNMYICRNNRSILYYDKKHISHIISGQSAERHKSANKNFEAYLAERGLYFPPKFLQAMINGINTGEPLRNFYKICKTAVLTKGFPLTTLTEYGSIIGKISQPSFVKNGAYADCRVEVALTTKGGKEYGKYLKNINDDVRETISSSDTFKKLGKEISKYQISKVYMTRDAMMIFEYYTKIA